MDVKIVNQRIAEVNNPKSSGLVVKLPKELWGTHLSKWLYIDGLFQSDPTWEEPNQQSLDDLFQQLTMLQEDVEATKKFFQSQINELNTQLIKELTNGEEEAKEMDSSG